MIPRTPLMTTAILFGISLAAVPAQANEFEPAMQGYFEQNLSGWAQDPGLVAAIEEANAVTRSMSADQIEALDQQWRAEVGTANAPTIMPVLENSVAAQLRGIVDGSGYTITEIILMDAQGLNVAVSAVTSDMWQGDEAKHQETYGVGPGAIHISDVEFDESTQTFQGQVSAAVTDPATGAVVGAITFGLNIDALM